MSSSQAIAPTDIYVRVMCHARHLGTPGSWSHCCRRYREQSPRRLHQVSHLCADSFYEFSRSLSHLPKAKGSSSLMIAALPDSRRWSSHAILWNFPLRTSRCRADPAPAESPRGRSRLGDQLPLVPLWLSYGALVPLRVPLRSVEGSLWIRHHLRVGALEWLHSTVRHD